MTKVIKREELDRKFTEAVARYMSKGLFIATASMCGHQGEDGKLDLTDGKVTYRVLAYEKHNFREVDEYVIEVRKYDEYVHTSMGRTLWNEEGELVETAYTAYRINNWGEAVYVETKEEAKAMAELQLKRCRVLDDRYWRTLDSFDAEKVAKAVRAKEMYGYKRVKAREINSVERSTAKAQYRINFNGKASIVIG